MVTAVSAWMLEMERRCMFQALCPTVTLILLPELWTFLILPTAPYFWEAFPLTETASWLLVPRILPWGLTTAI